MDLKYAQTQLIGDSYDKYCQKGTPAHDAGVFHLSLLVYFWLEVKLRLDASLISGKDDYIAEILNRIEVCASQGQGNLC